MKHCSILVCSAILLFVTACAPSAQPTGVAAQPAVASPTSAMQTALRGSPAAPTSARPTTPTVEPTLAPNPLNVKVKLDDKLAASAVISTTGGTLSVKAADGTKFALTIPKDALLDDEQITLIPVIGVDGLPFSGGLVGAVQMAPEGLRLFQPATLTIESPKATPAQGYDLVAFAYHQNGEGFYLTPSQAEGNKITLPVWHFSGGGAASGTGAEIQAQQRRIPANAEDAFRQRIQGYLGRERQSQLLTGNSDPEFEKKMSGFLREAYQSFIAPQLPLAAKDCEAARDILSRAIGWVRQVELLGSRDEFASEIENVWKTYEDAIVNCYNKAYDKCMAEDDLSQIAVMTGLLRQATLLSPAEGRGLAGRLDQSKIDECGTFELKFNSSIDGNFPQAGGGAMVFAMSVRASVPIKFNVDTKSFEGSAPLEYVSFSVTGVECLKAAAPRGGLFKVSDLDTSVFFDPTKKGKTDIRLKIDPGVTQETYSSTCPEIPFSLTDSLYAKFFEQLHSKEKAGNGYLISNWTPAGVGAMARKTFQEPNTCGAGGTCKENTTLELIHQAK